MLDEAIDYLKPQLFTPVESAMQSYNCEYLPVHSRNLQAPRLEAWDLKVRFLLIAGCLDAEQNPQLLKNKIS